MNRQLLPIGTVIETVDKVKLVIIGYEEVTKERIIYICGGYPSYYMTDFIPIKKLKEYKEKYNDYNTDCSINHDAEYRVVFMGYKNEQFYEVQRNIDES